MFKKKNVCFFAIIAVYMFLSRNLTLYKIKLKQAAHRAAKDRLSKENNIIRIIWVLGLLPRNVLSLIKKNIHMHLLLAFDVKRNKLNILKGNDDITKQNYFKYYSVCNQITNWYNLLSICQIWLVFLMKKGFSLNSFLTDFF